jgi:hypothetical protein
MHGCETLLPKSGSRVFNKQGNYIKTFPLLNLSVLLKKPMIPMRFTFIPQMILMELLKYGRNVKVSLKSLVATMKERIAEMENLYK